MAYSYLVALVVAAILCGVVLVRHFALVSDAQNPSPPKSAGAAPPLPHPPAGQVDVGSSEHDGTAVALVEPRRTAVADRFPTMAPPPQDRMSPAQDQMSAGKVIAPRSLDGRVRASRSADPLTISFDSQIEHPLVVAQRPPRTNLDLPKTEKPTPATARSHGPSSADRHPPVMHVVVPGDTLSSVALTYYGSPQRWVDVQAANPTINPDRLTPGQTIRLPRPGGPPARPPGATDVAPFHTVGTGDTLSRIARRYYGSSSAWTKLYRLNRDIIGPDPDQLVLGMTLKLPPGGLGE